MQRMQRMHRQLRHAAASPSGRGSVAGFVPGPSFSRTYLRVDLDRDDAAPVVALVHEVPDVVAAGRDVRLERLHEQPAEPVLAVLGEHGEARQLALARHEADRADGRRRGAVRAVREHEEGDVRVRLVDAACASVISRGAYSLGPHGRMLAALAPQAGQAPIVPVSYLVSVADVRCR